ncbi:Aste57867_24752 [Aphanomyces stellatus]|uniref:Aste57867_24752 protein n=1 Tax=Aphanomyces stellatus TaxID=120398 RepID=A0A485LR91_9STRA|nr:hypothetical protein As57867_024674 [Aphanomyces stellatus]VFU01388.1 Aste57867_24752 [Aphanomyces stellatus]
MGQLHGKATFVNAALPFLNISEKDVNKCWESFNDVAEGFGINRAEMIDICSPLQDTFEIKAKSEMERITGLLFDAMDTDENGLVDALEFLGALALLSAMTIPQKITFVYNCYDFNESGEITIDELTLAMKSTLTGLCKLCMGRSCPTEIVLEEIALFAFRRAGAPLLMLYSQRPLGKHPDKTITLPEYIKYVETTPEVNTWVCFFDAPLDLFDEYDLVDSDLETEAAVPSYSRAQAFNMDADTPNELLHQYALNEEPALTQPWQNTGASCPRTRVLTKRMNTTLRQCVHYVSTNEIVYPAASVAVLYDHVEHKQRYFQYHTDLILSVAVHPNGSVVATGERGSRPRICVWEVSSLRLLCTLRHFHTIGVSHLAWMPDERTLLSIGKDSNHSIAIYQWPTSALVGLPQLLFTERTSRYHVLAVQPVTPALFVTCGQRHLCFWYQESVESAPGIIYQAKPGVLGKKAKMQTLVSVAAISDKLVLSGSVRGEIWLWEGRNVIKVIFAHSAAVNVLHVFAGGVVSGGKDGKIRLWSKRMEPGASFDIVALGSFVGRVRSAVTNGDATKLLISTGGAEIYELSTSDGCNLHYGPLVTGHCSRKLGGLAAHPSNLEMCSVGDDQSIRVWDLVHHRNLRVVTLESAARCCMYSPDGKIIVVGYGTELESEKPQLNGAFVVLNEPNLAVKYQGKDSKRFISNIKFSADGTTLAICSENVVYMYNTDDWASKGKCRSKDPSVVFSHFDMSASGEWLQIATSKGEIVYYDTNSSVENTRLGALKDVQWATFTSIYGWPVLGAWPVKKNSFEVVSLNRNHASTVLVTGDQYGHIRVYKYPCQPSANLCHQYNGHCGRISHVEFSSDDQFVVTSGEDDRCLFQWRVESEVNEPSPPEFEYHATSDDEVELLPPSERSPFEEASNVGEFALDSLVHQGGHGQESVAVEEPVKPWVGSCIPPTTAAPEPDTTLSPEQLEMDWVYGYRSHDCRNNLKYTKQGKIVYPVAKVVVVFESKGWSQKHFKQHQDEVLCLATHPSLDIVASGEGGKYPAIHVWQAQALKVLSTLRGVHRRGVVEVAFNPAGNILASAGSDADNTIVLYDWELNVVLSQIKSGAQKLLGLAFNPKSTHTFVALSKQTILFYNVQGRNLIRKHALMGKRGFLQPFLSVVFLNQDAIVGSTSGELYKFKGIELVTIVPAHTRSVAALYVNDTSLVSGGRDGLVKIWSAELECLSEYNSCNQMPIRSLVWQNQSILVGTRDCAIFELSASDGSVQLSMEMHSKGEVQGLAVHPIKDKVITCGDDATLRIWDMYRHRCLLKFALETSSRAVAYSPEGAYVAVGLGGNPRKNRHKKDGTVLIYEEKLTEGVVSLEVLHETRDTKQPISVIKYSPDGVSLVVGAQDNTIYIYDVPNEYAKRATFTKHKSFITHVDVSGDSQYLRSNCGGFELLFADLTTGSHVASATALKNQTWATCHTIFNWYNQGAWPPSSTKTTVTASTANTTSLAVGDSQGVLKLFRFPCVRDGLPSKSYPGHVGAIQCTSFSQNGSYFLSAGLHDHSLIQWKVSPSMPLEKDAANQAKLLEADPDLETEGWFVPTPLPTAPFAGAKPYLSSLIPPSVAPDEPQSFPFELELEYAYGARLQDVRGTLGYTKSKRLVNTAGKIGISYDRKRHAQAFYMAHAAPLISMALSPDGMFVATGEEVLTLAASEPRIHVWDPAACTPVAVLPTFHTKAIVYLAFNDSTTRLVSVGKDAYHSMCIYYSASGLWHDARILASTRTTHQPVRFCAMLPPMQSVFDVVTGGADHLIFWRIDPPLCHATFGTFGQHGQIQMLTCGSALDKATVVTGTRTGHLYLWDANTTIVEKSVPAHSGTINGLAVSTLGVVTGSADGHVKVWSRSLAPIWDFDMVQAKPACSNPIVRSVAWDMHESRFLVGTKGGEIYELSQERGDTSLILESHSEFGLFGLATHPTQPFVVATGGEDCTLRVWNAQTHELVGKVIMDTPIKCVSYSVDGKLLAVGLGSASQTTQLKDGAFCILDATTMEIVHEGRDSKQSLADIKFSPDGTLLAIGSHDNCIYLHSVMENYSLKSKCTKATGHITHLDFSKDSRYLRANSDAYELIYLNTLDGAWISSPSLLRDVEWASLSCVLSWASQGIWGDSNDFVHAVGVAPRNKALICGTDKGELTCHSFPCLSKNMAHKTLLGHGGPVNGVAVNCDETILFTIGGTDRALFQWKLVG